MKAQLSLFKVEKEYGGSLNRNKAKIKRPLSTKKPIHVTLRSSKAIGKFSLLKHRDPILKVLKSQSEKWDVSVCEKSVEGRGMGRSVSDLEGLCRKEYSGSRGVDSL